MANLTGQNIKDTYQELVTLGTGNTITNGTGSLIENLAVTASYATNAGFATTAQTANTATSASHALIADTAGSAGSATTATSASHALIADNALAANTATSSSHALYADAAGSAATATSASYALTASYAANVPQGEATVESGNILFSNIYGEIYGSAASPTSGNITVDGVSTKVDGAVAIIYHTDSSEPTISGATVNKKLGIYENGGLNIITLTNIDGTNILEYIAGGTATTVASASYATYADSALSASYAATAPYSGLQGTVPTWNQNTTGTAATASYVAGANVDGAVALATNATSASHALYADAAGTATSASYASNAELLDGLDSTAFAILANNNTFAGTQTFDNINVNGTGSFAYVQTVTGSATIVGDAFIILNTNDAQRYAGLLVEDSGSAVPQNYTASFFFDSATNDWNYEYTSGTTDYGVSLFGPTYSTKGIPTYPTSNKLQKGNGNHHLTDSLLTDDGTNVSMTGDFQVTGGVTASAAIIANGGIITQQIISYPNINLDLGTLGTGDINITSAGGDIIVTGSIDTSDDILIRATGGDIKLRADYPAIQLEAAGGNAVNLYDVGANNGISMYYGGGTAASLGGIGSVTLTVTGNLTGNADTATSASHAVIADSALSATSATSASYATYAASAGTATSATSATEVTIGELTDNNNYDILFEGSTNNVNRDTPGDFAYNPSTGVLTTPKATIASLVYPSTDGSTGQAIVTDGGGNLSFASVVTTGTTDTGVTSVVFDNSIATVYNTAASPATGNITLSGTGAVTGGTAVIYHNDATAPTISGLTVDKTLGVYSASNLNIITIIYTGANVIVSIAGISPAVEGSAESGDLLFENQIGEIYGTSGTPLTGNITIDGSSTKVIGASAILYHNDATEPTVSGGTVVKKIGSYDVSALNMISFVYLGSGEYIQAIAGADVTGIITNSTDTYTSTAEVQHIVTCTAAEYSGLTPDANTFYIVI